MKGSRRIWIWFGLLHKRLWKKISFLCILCSSPLLVMGVNLMSEEESGMLKIVLAQEDKADAKAAELIGRLTDQDSVLHFEKADSMEDAYELVQRGSADAAWIFHEDMEEQIRQYVTSDFGREPIITVVEREDNVMLHLSREKLFGALHQDLVYAQYEHYVTGKLVPDKEVSEEVLREHYEKTDVEDNLFVLKYLDGEVEQVEMSYFALPIRGFLSLVIVLCGLASCMFFIQDSQRGMFTWLKVDRSVPFSWAYLLPGLLTTGVAVLLSLKISGNFAGWLRESGLMLLFIIMTAGFCDVVRRLAGSLVRLGALIPVILMIMLALCPIFMNIRHLQPIQMLLPPYYYLNAMHSMPHLIGMLFYIAVVYAVDHLLLHHWEHNKHFPAHRS